jgi:hypothetical protein
MTIRPLSIALASGLGLVYATAIWQSANPTAGPSYIAYFVEETTVLSPAEQARLPPVQRGKVYSHLDPVVGFGWWSEAEAGHRWSDGNKAEIVFRWDSATSGPRPRQLTVKLRTLGTQRVAWQLNGSPREETVLEGEVDWRIALAGEAIREGLNQVLFHFPDACRPDDQDTRELAVALQSLQFE